MEMCFDFMMDVSMMSLESTIIKLALCSIFFPLMNVNILAFS
jgi:hypothetical protein